MVILPVPPTVAASAPTPPPVPVPAPPLPTSNSAGSVKSILSNFYREDYIAPRGSIPPSAAPDNVGAFRFVCQAGPIGRFDPIVYPGQKNVGHLHQFFGNTDVAPDSSYESLRTTGDSTCLNKLNRSAYWIPAMLDGKGHVVRPDYVSIYYKRRPVDDLGCQIEGDECVPQPDGIRYIAGYDVAKKSPELGEKVWCKGNLYESRDQMIAKCGTITEFMLVVHAPSCWDGVSLDSSDHRSHVAYGNYAGGDGIYRCPKSHPKLIPFFSLSAHYTVEPASDDLSLWNLASDAMAETPAFASFHTDLWDAWDGPTKKTWTANCIDKLLNCSDGVLGDGTFLKRWKGFSFKAEPRLVDMPEGGMHH